MGNWAKIGHGGFITIRCTKTAPDFVRNFLCSTSILILKLVDYTSNYTCDYDFR